MATQTLHVFLLANLQVEKACEQATHYHNSGSKIRKSLGTDIFTLENVQDLNVSLLTNSKKFDKFVIANLSESAALKKSETKKVSTSIIVLKTGRFEPVTGQTSRLDSPPVETGQATWLPRAFHPFFRKTGPNRPVRCYLLLSRSVIC